MGTRMLYDFHRNQNAKKPGTIHATYLISGTKRSQKATLTPGGIKKDGEDDYMQSSPFMGSFMPQPDEGTRRKLCFEHNIGQRREFRRSIHPSPILPDSILSSFRNKISIRANFLYTHLQSRTPPTKGLATPHRRNPTNTKPHRIRRPPRKLPQIRQHNQPLRPPPNSQTSSPTCLYCRPIKTQARSHQTQSRRTETRS